MAQSTFPKPVDQEIKDLNSKIDTYVISSNTLSNVESALVSFGATLGEDEIHKIRFNISTATGVFSNQGYMGTIKKYGTASRYTVEVQNCAYNGKGKIITGNYYEGSWNWDSLSSNIANNVWGGNSTYNKPASADVNTIENAYTNANNYSKFDATSSASQGLYFIGFKRSDSSGVQATGICFYNYSINSSGVVIMCRKEGTWYYSTPVMSSVVTK